jgi:hypothetical protein
MLHAAQQGTKGWFCMAGRRVEVVVEGNLGSLLEQVGALHGFSCTAAQHGGTRIVGQVPDQAAVLGLLELLDELHVEVVSVRRVEGAAP